MKRNDSAAAKKAWASRKRMKEARELREKASIIEPAGTHAVKAEYKAKVMQGYQPELVGMEVVRSAVRRGTVREFFGFEDED